MAGRKRGGQVELYLLEDQREYRLPEGFPYPRATRVVDAGKCAEDYQADRRLGESLGLFELWRRERSRYLCVNYQEFLPQVTARQVEKLFVGKYRMVLVRVYLAEKLQEVYRSSHYGYDFRMMLSVLKRDYPPYYSHMKEKLEQTRELIFPCGVFSKSIFDRTCAWMLPILGEIGQHLPRRRSEYQNRCLEHLVPYLFTIYVTYWKKKYPYELVLPVKMGATEKNPRGGGKGALQPSLREGTREAIVEYLEGELRGGRVEQASVYARALLPEREELADLREIFEQYERERRYFGLTLLDGKTLREQLDARKQEAWKGGAPKTLMGKPKMLVLEWESVGHKANLQALRDFGFECHTIRMPVAFREYDEEIQDQLNVHMDRNAFDVVFSLNCVRIVAEACYVHNVPYIAWCYDSPSFVGRQNYLLYPTTHVFLFDSDDYRNYQEAGVTQSYYLPLATNLSFFEKVKGDAESRRRFGADISFVGSLYDSSLPKAMGYLTDYQKAYLNALMDNQQDVYGYSFFPDILSRRFMEYLSEPHFNRLLSFEFTKDMKKASRDAPAPGQLMLMLNKQTTNRERILLLNLLAKYHEVKLYSYHDDEALKGMTYCGTADYYTQMPLIFRHSRINLNATLRSIQHGIPLRCIDIMGCRGLLLTNYQKDFDDHFEDEKNLLFYTDAEEALEKANFYLAHEALRARIAEAGYETVRKYYDYPVKLREMFEMAGLEALIPGKSIYTA